MSGDKAEQVAVGGGPKGFSAVTVIVETAGGKERRAFSELAAAVGFKTVFVLEFVESSEGDAVSAVEVGKGVKELGFELRVGAKLRRRFGAYTFIDSHGCL